MTDPVVLLIYNRPEALALVVERVRAARPPHVFVVADGPKPDRSGDAERCAAARAVIDGADWDCEVTRILADRNLGLAARVTSGLDEVFARVDRAVILEDDCVPDPTFFPYCDDLLRRYADDPRVFVVSGSCFQRRRRIATSYTFSRYPHCWGWATWARAWARYRGAFDRWPELEASGWLRGILDDAAAVDRWTRIFDRVREGRVVSWAYPWTLACWLHGGLTAVPAVNLVENVGYGPEGTHTTVDSEAPPAEPIELPLVHPAAVERNARLDGYVQLHWFERRALDRARAASADRRTSLALAAPYRRDLGPRARSAPAARRSTAALLARALAPRSALRRVVRGLRALSWQSARELSRLYAAPRHTPLETALPGTPFRVVDGPSAAAAYEEIFLRGSYAFEADRDDPRIVDCGANVGLAVLYWKRIHPRARIVAFEPDPAAFAALEANVAAAGLDGVELRREAAWVRDGTVRFRAKGADAGHVADASVPGPAGVEEVAVRAARLRDVLDEPVDLLKLDIEGGELEVLRDCADRLDNVELLFVEVHSRVGVPQPVAEIAGILDRAGFRLQVHSAYAAPYPFVQCPPNDGMDLRLNVWAYRVARAAGAP